VDRRSRHRARARAAVRARKLAGRQARDGAHDLRLGGVPQLGARLAGRACGRRRALDRLGFSKLGAHGVEVDWLDQRPLAPFARKGLRSVFLLGLYSALFSLFLLAPWGKPVAVPLLILFPLLCVAALLLPVTGVHRRLVAVKRTELARVDAALRAEAETNLKGGAGDAIDARLSNLVAYRRLVEDAGTWPFDLAIWLRFGLYVSLGLGSWLGGALVERLLGAALD